MAYRLAATRAGQVITMLAVLLMPVRASAQNPVRLPWFALDLHGASVGLPTAEGWVPAVPATTPLPARAWGLAGGATVYPFKLGMATVGLGVWLATGEGTSDPLTSTTGTGATALTVPTTTTVTTRVLGLSPHLSINFGRRYGWSYLSAGFGRTRVSGSSEKFRTAPEQVLPESWTAGLNFGGGARWFMKPHLGAGFDVRFTRLSSRATTPATETTPAAKGPQLVTISVGISIQ